MPYIKQEDRKRLADGDDFNSTGELNYTITLVCKKYLDQYGTNYSVINNIMGALEGAKLEFYRRVAAPYEDGKIKENGDVY